MKYKITVKYGKYEFKDEFQSLAALYGCIYAIVSSDHFICHDIEKFLSMVICDIARIRDDEGKYNYDNKIIIESFKKGRRDE